MTGLFPLSGWLALQLLGQAAVPAQAAVPTQAAVPAPSADATLAAWSALEPGCGAAKYCFEIALHVVNDPQSKRGAPVQTPQWFATQVSEANRHFAAINTAFMLHSVDVLDARFAHIATREDRDAVGRHTFTRGVVHVFLVAQLDDVDAIGEQIRGLHWRQRSNIAKRWVILSAIAPDMVLAHEFGHFFSLPHSSFAVSIMNKRRRAQPPREARTFHSEEVVQMRSARNEMVRDGMLRKRRR